jgi:hypothetical protein
MRYTILTLSIPACIVMGVPLVICVYSVITVPTVPIVYFVMDSIMPSTVFSINPMKKKNISRNERNSKNYLRVPLNEKKCEMPFF